MKIYSILCLAFLVGCNQPTKKEAPNEPSEQWTADYQAISMLGDTLRSSTASDKMMAQYRTKKASYDADPNLENTIWLGRFTAYKGDYRKAIEIYSEGLQKFPDESRLLRHRGHRYISVREFDKAINDLEKAADLISGKENRVEEDGMPNPQGIPVSTMHGNIYYHLGLAHYLAGNDEKAIDAYKKCLQTSSNADNVVSATHWLYTISCRMGNHTEAQQYLNSIQPDMKVIENEAYLQACLLYKGSLKPSDLAGTTEDSPSNSALAYGLGNFMLCKGDTETASVIFNEIVSGSDWASFGYIAAEVDLATKF